MNLLLNFILTTGIVISVLITGVLLSQSRNDFPKQILSLIFLVLCLVIIHNYGELNSLRLVYGATYIFGDAVGFLIGPLLLLYVHSIYCNTAADILPKGLLHFIPAISYILIVSVPSLLAFYGKESGYALIRFINEYEFVLQLQPLYLLCYLVSTFFLLKNYQRQAKQYYADLTKKDLQWVVLFIVGIAVIICTNSTLELVSLAIHGIHAVDNTTTTVVLVAVVCYLGFHGVSQSRILLPLPTDYVEKKVVESTIVTESVHHLSNASSEEIALLKNRLLELIKTEKPYLDEDLNLKTLAELVPTTDRKLSALLNHYLGTNFYDFINCYRVKEVQGRMGSDSGEKYTILALAFEAGFSSKSTFNRIFKKETGIAPSAYRRKLLRDK